MMMVMSRSGYWYTCHVDALIPFNDGKGEEDVATDVYMYGM